MIVRVRHAIAPLLSGLLAFGCISESHVPGDPVALERFCESFFDAACAPLEECGCGTAAVDECRAEERAICAGYPSAALRAAVDAGRVVYDDERAAQILARLRARGCDGFVSTLDWRTADLFDLGGTFVGRAPAGASCASLGFELISECASGGCVPGAEGNVCRTSVDEGAACDRTHQCVDLDARLTGGAIDRLVLRCETEPGADAGVCRAWTVDGQACAAEGECWTGRCEGEVCVSRGDGEACLSSRECAEGLYCASLICVPGGRADGEACDDALACASSVCVAGLCRPPGCDLF